MMKTTAKACVLCAAAVLVLLAGIGIGSVTVPPGDILAIFANRFWGAPLPEGLSAVYPGLVMDLRLPRVLLAFFVGAALSVSGTVMQSVLKNPLASSYGLGVSSGAGLGAALVMIFGLSSGWLGSFLMPVTGLVFGLATVIAVVTFSARIDRSLSNNTIILAGMVLSLFLNAIMMTLASANPNYTQRILMWQLGSFTLKEWRYVAILAPVTVACVLFFCHWARTLDVMTFGEEQAASLGVDLRRTKWLLIGMTAALTGTAVAFVGAIGFVDLIAPHVIRRFFGASHRVVIPAAAVFGGAFMVLCDLAARTLASPSEIPIGSITALLGAPFFFYLYFFAGKKRG